MSRSRLIRINRNAGLGRADLRGLGSTVCVLTADPGLIAAASLEVQNELAALDAGCNAARGDSELEVANRAGGHQVALGPVLAEAVEAALRGARVTGGGLDPTTGTGPDRPDWTAIRFNRQWGTLQIPPGLRLDLTATLPALAADRAAARAAGATGQGVLVGVGGCLAVAGSPPAGGWNIAVADRAAHPRSALRLLTGGLATSTGSQVWKSVSVAAPTCVDARLASAAAVRLEEAAAVWLASRGLAARLIRSDGTEEMVGEWPAAAVAA